MNRFLFAVLTVAVLIAAPPALAQSTLEQAYMRYQDADMDGAADLLVVLAEDESADKGERRQALEMLGLIYLRQRREAEAREAMARLLNLEPPLVDVDVDQLHPELAAFYLEARRDAQGSYAVETREPGLHTLAIADFNNNAIHRRDEFDPMTEGFAVEMIRLLNGATDLRVVERARLDWLLRELELQRDGNLVDQSTAVEVGRLLGASAVLLGDFVILGDQLRLGVRFVSVETGEILRAATVTGSPDDIFGAIEALSLQTAAIIQEELDTEVQIDTEEMGQLGDTQSTEALLAYVEGRRLLEQGDEDGAMTHFQQALAIDPELDRAQRQINQIQPFVAAGN